MIKLLQIHVRPACIHCVNTIPSNKKITKRQYQPLYLVLSSFSIAVRPLGMISMFEVFFKKVLMEISKAQLRRPDE